MSELFKVDVKYGTVESQLRYVPIENGFKSQSRRIERDLTGAITLVSDWKDLGTRITFGESERPLAWWRKWLPF